MRLWKISVSYLGYFNVFYYVCYYGCKEAQARKISHMDAGILLLLLSLGFTIGNVTGLQPISLGHNEPFRIFSWVAPL